MSIFQIVILGAAGITALVSFKLPRALIWIAAITGIYLVTNWYWLAGLPNPSLFAALCDAALAGEILRSTHHKKERWQFWTALIVQTMLIINLVYTASGHLMNVTLFYQSSLEFLNIAAFVVIGGTAISELAGRHDNDTFSITLRNIRAFMRTVLSQSKTAEG